MDPNRVSNLFNLGLFNIKLGLDNIRELLNLLGNPHHHPRTIHIAGTNGKGSTLVTLEKLLMDSGYSTGSTISPHLITFNERFRINGTSIDDTTLEFAFLKVCDACGIHPDLSPETLATAKVRPTFFEFSIAMAFVLFQEFQVDYILLETGLGGRLDATNVVECPVVNVLTRIDLDHQSVLGDTIEKIAAEKLGILKPGAVVFSAQQQESVLGIIRSTCAEKGNSLYYCPRHFRSDDPAREQFARFQLSGLSEELNLVDFDSTVPVPSSGLIGEHQRENLLTALASYLFLVPSERRLTQNEIASAFSELNWPGRLEYLKDQDKILLDAAHNVSGMHSLLKHLKMKHSGDQILLAVGWTQHHELIPAFAGSPVENATYLPVQMRNERSLGGDRVYASLSESGLDTLPPITTKSLVHACRENGLPQHDLLVIAGSLYLVGEFLAEWNDEVVQS